MAFAVQTLLEEDKQDVGLGIGLNIVKNGYLYIY